ncbi:hypothetical protein MLD38_006006 [Melastoma candidum]|uniref:Uncharacterized protein n=1 Tax=Melastoma candidum TaxID=119954 RepID=A0ACB9RL52_9MYRT|nr:hypothetical protein MLD38_006006 [Melastoma candidum]
MRPGFIHGTPRVGSMKIPLSVVGSPLEMVLQHAKPLTQLPLVGPPFTPPVNVTVVARVAVRASHGSRFPSWHRRRSRDPPVQPAEVQVANAFFSVEGHAREIHRKKITLASSSGSTVGDGDPEALDASEILRQDEERVKWSPKIRQRPVSTSGKGTTK